MHDTNMSYYLNVQLPKCPVIEMSCYQNVCYQNVHYQSDIYQNVWIPPLIPFQQSSSSSIQRLARHSSRSFPGGDTQCPSVTSYPADVPCAGPFPFSDLFNHVCDLGLFSYPNVCFSVPVCDVSIFICAAASLFFAWVVSVHVSAPYVIAGSTHELYICLFKHVPCYQCYP